MKSSTTLFGKSLFVLAVLTVMCSLLVASPAKAYAAHDDTTIDLDVFNFGANVPVGTYTNWSYSSAIQKIFVTDDITVIGTATGTVGESLDIDIPAGKTLTWEGVYSSAPHTGGGGPHMIRLSGGGTFEVAPGAVLTNHYGGAAVFVLSAETAHIVVSGGSIIGNSDAINFFGSGSVTVSSGIVQSNYLGNGITASAFSTVDVVVSGGLVTTKADTVTVTSAISVSNGSVSVSGGIVCATKHYAIYMNSATSVATITGGFVFAYGTDVTGLGNVVFTNGGGTTSITAPGVVVAWNQGAGRIEYDEGTSTHLTCNPTSTATWHDDAILDGGINYANGSNTGFFPLPVTVLAGGALPLAFTYSAAYDIPASTVEAPIAGIDVSGGASGGTTPYAFSATGLPAGISISTAGVISGTPTTAGAAGTATITVTDSASDSASITINYGEIVPLPSQISYTVIKHFGTWTGSGAATGITDGPYNKFEELFLEGAVVASASVAESEGNTVITLSESYLKTLANGNYTFKVEFTEGKVELTLTVNVQSGSSDNTTPPPGNNSIIPPTGDSSAGLGWMIALLASMLALAGLLVWRRMKASARF